jgi:hypothetical protein
MAQFEIQIAPFFGLLAGVAYSNENLSGIETEEDDVQHFLQFALFLIMINVVWYTKKETDNS